MGMNEWVDSTGVLWVYGGMTNWLQEQTYSDMWKFIPDESCMGNVISSITYQLSENEICKGDTAYLTLVDLSNASISPASNLQWVDSTHISIFPDSTTSYLITGSSQCRNSDSALITVYITPAPAVTITAGSNLICPGDTTQVCAPAGYISYNWNTGNTTACINTTSAGNYYVTIGDTGNCNITSNHLSISNYPPTTVSTNVTGDTLKGFNATSYQWFLNDTVITGATDSIYIAKTGGSYTLQITDSNGCIENSNPIVITGINNEPSENNIAVFPNPTSTGWQLNVSGEWIGSAAEIFDATGRSVFKSTIASQHSMIEITGIANGVYELRLAQQGYTTVKKLIKM
jgi:hypothetical protein